MNKKINMKRLIYRSLAVLFTIASFISCESDKTYDGPAQVAFVNKTASYEVTANTTLSIPVQLIADGGQSELTVNVSVNSASTCADAVTVPASVSIPAGRYTGEIQIPVSYDKLTAGNTNKLILELNSNSVKIAANYATLTVTLTKK